MALRNIGYRNYEVDGVDVMPYLTGKTDKGPRQDFFYWNDDGQLVAMRYGRWKLVFMEQRSEKFGVWMEPFVELRVPLVFDLRMDPFERAQHNANGYYEWMEGVIQWAGAPSQQMAGKMIMSFKKYPPRQKPASFNLDLYSPFEDYTGCFSDASDWTESLFDVSQY